MTGELATCPPMHGLVHNLPDRVWFLGPRRVQCLANVLPPVLLIRYRGSRLTSASSLHLIIFYRVKGFLLTHPHFVRVSLRIIRFRFLTRCSSMSSKQSVIQMNLIFYSRFAVVVRTHFARRRQSVVPSLRVVARTHRTRETKW